MPSWWTPSTRRSTDRQATCPGLDDDHRRAAMRADKGRRHTPLRNGRCRPCRRNRQQRSNTRQRFASPGIGQQAVMANAMETVGQNVQQEPAHELLGRERHCLLPGTPLGAVILPAKRHPILVERDQPTIRDRHPVRIARQIGEHRCRTGKRTFGIDHPFAGSERRPPAGKSICVGQSGEFTE